MTIVTQYNNYACVAACLESIKKDFGDSDFSHKEFVQDNLDLFSGGLDTEGACDFFKIREIATRAGLEAGECKNGTLTNSDSEAAILFVYWGDDEGNKHCVRLHSSDDKTTKVMNPMNPNHLDEIPISWIKGGFKIKKPNKA